MGLSSGCTKECDTAFMEKHNCAIITDISTTTVTIYPTASNTHNWINLIKLPHDCTAAFLNSTHIQTDKLLTAIPLIQEYLSLNARINCFATRLIKGKQETKEFIQQLVSLGCKISNVCIGNRNQNPNEFMVAYNICVPNPQIKNYAAANKAGVNNPIDYMDASTVNEIRKKFGLYIKQGKSL